MPSSVVLSSFARALPPRRVTNEDLTKLMETSDEWIVQRSGIRERYWVTEPQTTSDLGTEAGRESLARLGSEKIDAVIAATLSSDYGFPGIGVQIQAKLGLPTIPAFDIRNQCSGFLYGVEMATALVSSGVYRRILLVGAEVHSTGLDLTTRGRDIAVLFGDGAGSCVVERKEDATGGSLTLEVIGTELHSDGAHVEELWCEHPGSSHFPVRITKELIEEGRCFPKMNGKRVFENAVKRMTEVSLSLLSKHGITPPEVRMLVPHQANMRINQMVASHIGLKDDQCFNTIDRFGNTTAATIPIGLSCLEEAMLVKSGDIVLSAAFGSGFTWGAALLRVI